MGLYKLTIDDEQAIHAIDDLFAAKTLFEMGKDEYGMPIFGWVEALKAADDEQRMAAVMAAYDQHCGKGDPPTV